MNIAIQNGLWRRGAGTALIVMLLILTAATDARAVFLYSTADRNTTPPSAAQGLDAWNLQANWGSFLATPIDDTHFIAAKHVGMQSGTITVTSGTSTLNLLVDSTSGKADPYSDLAIYSLQSGYTFPAYAPLYCSSIDGSMVGKTLTVIGRGTQRGSEVLVGGTGSLAGWQWGANDHVRSWGQNVVTGLTAYNSNPESENSLLYFDFDANGIANEAAMSNGDSSGAVFIYADGQWKLAGINYAVDSPWSLTGGTDTGFYADIFDARGIYYKNAYNEWELVPSNYHHPVPGASYASAISSRLSWIEAMVPTLLPGDASGDGSVNGTDLNTVLSNYNQIVGTGEAGWTAGDFNSDQSVNGTDLNTLLSNYNTTLGASSVQAAVPEPGTVAMLGAAILFFFGLSIRRRRYVAKTGNGSSL